MIWYNDGSVPIVYDEITIRGITNIPDGFLIHDEVECVKTSWCGHTSSGCYGT